MPCTKIPSCVPILKSSIIRRQTFFGLECDVGESQLVLHKRTSAQSVYSRVRLHVSAKC